MTQTQTFTLTTPRCTCQHPTPAAAPQPPPPPAHLTLQGYVTFQPWSTPSCTSCGRTIPPSQPSRGTINA